MNLANKQVIYSKPQQVSQAIHQGMYALAEQYGNNIGEATNHCLDRVDGLTEAKLTRSRSKNPPKSTRNGQTLVTLLWVLLADGMLPHRPPRAVRGWLVDALEATNLFEGKLTEAHLPEIIALFQESIGYALPHMPPSPDTITQTISRVWSMADAPAAGTPRQMPIFSRLFVGREADVENIYARLGLRSDSEEEYRSLTIVRGWPGVGKTALVNAILHDEAVREYYHGDLLWAYVGQNGDALSTLKGWARDMGARHLLVSQSIAEVQAGLRAVLAGRHMLVVADDIWTEEQGNYIKHAVDLKANTLLLATRFRDVANALKDRDGDIYVLEALPEIPSIELLEAIAPTPTRLHQRRMPELVQTVEGLPLALRVAGPLLQHYHDMGISIDKLIDEFASDYNRLLESTAPADRFDEVTGKTPTIELLFKRSVETLSPNTRLAFAGLSAFKHKPATFDLKAVTNVWQAGKHTERLVSEIAGRGLIDTTPDNRFRIHQTLHMYARKLLDAHRRGEAI